MSQPSFPLQIEGAGSTAIPEDAPQTTTIQVDGASVKLDNLGPMVVNNDGTLSRIANWVDLTDSERARTIRVLSTRNKLRLEKEETKESEGSGERLSVLSPSK